MLAINGDVEWTSWPMQLALMDEFARRDLETAFSFWFFCNPKATWRLLDAKCEPLPWSSGAAALGRAGLLDTVHAFGGRRHAGGCDFVRQDIAEGFAFLSSNDWRPRVFTNHGSADDTQNIGGYGWATYHQGDVPGSDQYHLDLTLDHGIRFFWCDPDYSSEYPVLRSSLDRPDSLFVAGAARDGSKILRFRRWLGNDLPHGPSLDNLHVQLTELLERWQPGGYSVLYQHLGVERDETGAPHSARMPPLPEKAAQVLDRLATSQRAGDILVTTTSRLLMHAALMAARPWKMAWRKTGLSVRFDRVLRLGHVEIELSPEDLQGWAVELPSDTGLEMLIGDMPLDAERFDVDGRHFAGLQWKKIDMQATLNRARSLSGP